MNKKIKKNYYFVWCKIKLINKLIVKLKIHSDYIFLI